MTSSVDFGSLAFKLGDIEKTISSELISVETKAVSIAALADHNSIIANLSKLIKKTDAHHAEIKVLVCATMLCMSDRKNCVGVFNTIDSQPKFKNEFFLSAYNFIGQLLSEFNPVEYSKLPILIGDSHILGFSSNLATGHNHALFYCPGLRFSFLSHPKMNMKKTNLLNALTCSVGGDHLAFSIGDIDVRSLYSKNTFNNDDFENLYRQMLSSHAFILDSILETQRITYILPACPYSFNEDKNHSFCDTISEIFGRFAHAVSDRAECVLINDFLLDGAHVENFVDRAHYQPEIYSSILKHLELRSAPW